MKKDKELNPWKLIWQSVWKLKKHTYNLKINYFGTLKVHSALPKHYLVAVIMSWTLPSAKSIHKFKIKVTGSFLHQKIF